MIKKNILSIALLSVLGLSHAAEVENLKTISYLNEPLRLHADVVGDGKVEFAAPTEYLRLNHPIPSYDLSIDIVESGGKRELIVTTTEAIDSPVLTLLLESYDSENRKQLFELPILLDFKPEPVEEMLENSPEIVVDGVDMGPAEVSDGATSVELVDVPTANNDAKDNKSNVDNADATKTSNETAKKSTPTKKSVVQDKNKVKAEQEGKDKPSKNVVKQNTKASKEKPQAVTTQQLSKDDQKRLKDASDALTQENNNALIKRYGPVAEGETLWSIANKVRPSNTTAQRMIDVIRKNNPSAFTAGGVLRANVVLVIPGKTEKIQSNFVKAQENKGSSKIRVGFIYELPDAPKVDADSAEQVAVVAPHDETATEQVAVVAPQDETATEQVTVAPPQDETATEQVAVVAPQDETTTEQATTTAPKVEDAAIVEEAPVKVLPRKFVYVPEPEPEPNLVELIFDNIIYIGAGAGTLLLAVLIIVMRRRKKDDGAVEKPKKEKKATGFGRKKKGADEDQSESVAEPARKARGPLGRKKHKDNDVADLGVVAATTMASATIIDAEKPVDIIVESTFEAPIEESVGDLDFDLSSLEQVADDAINASSEVVDSDDFDLSSLTSASDGAIEATGDFDLSSLGAGDDVEASSDLDFDLSSLELGDDVEASGNLDISLDSFATGVEATETTSEADSYGDLDFDLSFEGLTEEQNSKAEASQATSVNEDIDGLDFDLSKLATANTVDESLGAISNNESGDDFGENNPIFSQQASTESDGAEMVEDADGKASDYISFSDLMKTAETDVDNETTEDTFDFSSIEGDDEAQLANLLEDSSHDAAETKLDFSFVAETEDVDASQSFLDSLDLSDDVESHIDVIGDSIKDNIAMTTESMTELSNLSLQSAAEPANIEEVAPLVDAPEIESISLTEPMLVETQDIEPVSLTEPMLAEVPEIEPVSLTEPLLVEIPEIEPVSLTEPMLVEAPDIEFVSLAEPMVDDTLDFGINLTEEEVPAIVAKVEEAVDHEVVSEPAVVEFSDISEQETQEKIGEREVVVEKVVEVEKPVIVEVPVVKSEVSEDENESEQIKLELAIAYMDFDKSLAKPLLDEVIRDGNATQISKAQNLLAQMD